jgi:hypothetical protein
MWTLALIEIRWRPVDGDFAPCILPVLPVIFFAGAQTATDRAASPRESGGLDTRARA